MKGKWAKGIEPRNFNWVLKDSLAYSERPGGHTANHRRVRRHEEIVWIREHGFHRIVSILGSPHNLHAYEEMNMPYAHVPFGGHDDSQMVMAALFPQLRLWLEAGEKILMHADEVSDKLQGIVGGYLLYTGKLANAPQAITVVETLMSRQLGEPGREIIVAVANSIHASIAAQPAAPAAQA
jgi:hypothetical protein